MFSKFQLLRSYLHAIPLEEASSAYNPYLQVSLRRGRIRLCAANTTYSYQDLYVNFYTVFKRLQLQRRRLSKVLVLGFGLGSIPYMLQRRFGQQGTQYVGVDIDDVILRLAEKYMPADILSNLTLHCADALEWVKIPDNRPKEGYDLVAVDIFIDRNTPSPFTSVEFLTAAKALLNPKTGVLAYNALADVPEQRQIAQQFYDQTFSQVFEHALPIHTTYNLMLVHDPLKNKR